MDADDGQPCPRCGHRSPAAGAATVTRERAGSSPAAQAAAARLRRRSAVDAFLAREGLSAAGMTAFGLLLIVTAVGLHAHFAQVNALCSSGLGQLGQAFSSTAMNDCSLASTAESAVGPLTFFGVILLLLGSGTLVHALTRPRRQAMRSSDSKGSRP